MPSRAATAEESVVFDTLYELLAADITESRISADGAITVLMRLTLDIIENGNIHGFDYSLNLYIAGLQEEVMRLRLSEKE